MSKYKAIKEQLRVEVDKKHHGTVDSLLREVEQRNVNDEFCDAYIKLQNVGFSPYDSLVAFMKGLK